MTEKPDQPADAVGEAVSVTRIVASAAARSATSLVKGAVGLASDALGDGLGTARDTVAWAMGDPVSLPQLQTASLAQLRAVGYALIEASWDSDTQPRDSHPAYARILVEMTPDEARILRLLLVAGPQPSLDVRTRRPFGVGSQRIAGDINMIADLAGCAWPDRDRHYLQNLLRLGLVEFSAEKLVDIRRYQILEVDRKTTRAMRAAGGHRKCRTIYRSIHLTEFGSEFAQLCLPTEGYTAGGWADSATRTR